MKQLLWVPVAMLLTALIVAGALMRITGTLHLKELGIAAGITLVSAQIAMIPLVLVRKAGPVANFQAAFGGSVIHLFFTLAAGAGCYALHLVGDRQLFLFLLLGFYWFSLMYVVIAMIKLFRRSLPRTGQGQPGQTASS